MMRNNRGIWLAAAVGVALGVACGTTGPNPGTSCTTDASCDTGKGCHPVLKTCVATCTGAVDCPSAEKTCAPINSSTSSFCTCSTDALCANSVADNICNNATKQCTAKCTANSCPSGFTCDSTSGNCTGGGGTDAGTDAGVTDAGVTCDNANQPDTCLYGNVCSATNTCEAIVDGTCGNVAGRPAWTSASTGPVIYRVDDEAVDNAAACGGGATPFTTTVFAYAAPGSTFPANESNLPGFFYYTTSGAQTDIPAMLLTSANYTRYANDTVMSAKFTLCSNTATTSLVAGFGFTNGNSVCVTLTH